MELRHLRYFVAVARCQSFRRAAEELHVSQPALSKQIRDLEESVGARLLERSRRGTKVTEAGEVFHREAKAILRHVERAAGLARDTANEHHGRFEIMGIGAVYKQLQTRVLTRFHREHPKVDIRIREVGFQDVLADLRREKIHFGYTVNIDEQAVGDEVRHAMLWLARVCIAVGKEHPLAGRKSVSLREIEGERFLCIGQEGSNGLHRRKTEEVLGHYGVKPELIQEIGGEESLYSMIGANYGVALTFPGVTDDQVVTLPMKERGEHLEMRFSAVWRKNSRSLLCRSFVEMLREEKELVAEQGMPEAE